jgi:competence protein CoiA
MSIFVINKHGNAVFADSYSDDDWLNLKEHYAIGDFLMPCCASPAVPKTSPNFLKYFSHYSDECASSPESMWHIDIKERVLKGLKALGIDALLEFTGHSKEGTWKADVYFEINNRKVAIEIQKSYQPLREYLKRQKRYSESKVETYWLLYQPHYITITKSLGKHKLKNEYSGKFPSEGYIFPCIPELPIAYCQIEHDVCLVKGAGFFNCLISDWLNGILNMDFKYIEGQWKLGKNN